MDDFFDEIIEGIRPGETISYFDTVIDDDYDYFFEEYLGFIMRIISETDYKVLCWLSKKCKNHIDINMPEVFEKVASGQIIFEVFDDQFNDVDFILDTSLEHYSDFNLMVVDCYNILDLDKRKKYEKNYEAFQTFAKEIKVSVILGVPTK